MEIPTEAVRTLSSTEWGALLVLTIAVSSVIVYTLVKYIRQLNQEYATLYDKRLEDVNNLHNKAYESLNKSQDLMAETSQGIEETQRALAEVKRMISEGSD